MKVLHAAETIKGGVATVLSQLVISQLEWQEVSDLKCLIPDLQSDELQGINKKYIITFRREKRNLFSLIAFLYSFSKTVYKFKPDIIHLHSTFAGILGRVVLFFLLPFFRPKIVYCPHAFSFLMTTSKAKKNIYIFAERMLQPMTDVYICVSNFEKRNIRYYLVNT
ncbi:glycosyltransferase [Sodalis sp. RH22]|uniref:glycosyltransferase n=1 Tax=Sodalis sp. RH22 TaxID=3394337 RepID=UPI0039B37B26